MLFGVKYDNSPSVRLSLVRSLLRVAAKKEELKAKTKRIFRNPRKPAEDRRAETKEVRDEAREALLND
jgi:hypothetical protein